MLLHYSLSALLTNIDQRLDRFLSVQHWQWRVIWICLLVSVVHMVLTNPSCLWFYQFFFKVIGAGEEFDVYSITKAQAATFFTDFGFSHFNKTAYSSYDHSAKMQFRLLLPAIVALFGITRVSLTLWLIQVLLSVVFAGLATRLAFRLTSDRISSFLFVLALSLLYPLRSAWLDISAYGDFFSYLLLLIAIYTRQPIVVFLALQAGFWADERVLLGSGFVLLWHGFLTRTPEKAYRVTGAQVAVIASGLLYLLLRYWLSLRFAMPSVEGKYWSEFGSTYFENIKIVGFRVWSGFQGAWLLILLSFVLLLYNRYYVEFALLFGLLVLTINLSFIVVDVNRASSYSYLVLFCSLAVLSKLTTTAELRRVLVVVLAGLLISPLPNRLRILMGISLM